MECIHGHGTPPHVCNVKTISSMFWMHYYMVIVVISNSQRRPSNEAQQYVSMAYLPPHTSSPVSVHCPLHFQTNLFYYRKLIVITLIPIALRKTKIVCNFGLSECNRFMVTQSLEFSWQTS